MLAFSDKINWDEFAVIIHSSEIDKLPDILKNVNIEEKYENLLKVKHMFNFDYTYKYILETIKPKYDFNYI